MRFKNISRFKDAVYDEGVLEFFVTGTGPEDLLDIEFDDGSLLPPEIIEAGFRLHQDGQYLLSWVEVEDEL